MRAVASGVLAGVLAGLTLVADAQPAPDRARAKELYQAAETAMREARYDDAIRDYGAAYDLAPDPAFFWKLGSANQRAGKCDVAVVYYRRYLREAAPSESFVKVTRARIDACGGDPAARAEPGVAGATGSAGAAPPEPPPTAGNSASPEPGPEPAAEPAPAPAPPAAGAAPTTGAGSAAPATSPRLGRHKGPWLLVGGAIAFATLGAVFAYSSDTAERDVEDLYVGLAGTPPPFNATTRKLYDDAIAEGRRYEKLSLVGFGVAGALAVGAAVWFAVGRDERITVAPAVAPGTAGAAATIRF
jgi:hypothetical protein